jgi:hypothetical protein
VQGDEGSGGGGPGIGDAEAPDLDPCIWSTDWLPDYGAYYQDTWRMVTTGDGVTYAADWIAAIEPDVDADALLAEYRETLAACGSTPQEDANGPFTITIVPDIEPTGLGDASFSYRADFATLEGEVYGSGELHTFLCGPLWIQLSYIGYDPFVERDALLALLEERAAALGGC